MPYPPALWESGEGAADAMFSGETPSVGTESSFGAEEGCDDGFDDEALAGRSPDASP